MRKGREKNWLNSNLLYTAWMKPGFMAMRNISTSMIARELLRRPHAIVATINTLVSSFTIIKENADMITTKIGKLEGMK